MTGLIKKAALGATLAATLAAVPAEAQRYRDYRHHRGNDAAGAAIVGGIIGLGLGAAIASSNRDRYYDRGYQYDGYYAQPQYNYYAQPRGYYNDRSYRRDWRRCFNERRFDYYGRPYRVRVCR